jgi:hypothetical protein
MEAKSKEFVEIREKVLADDPVALRKARCENQF